MTKEKKVYKTKYTTFYWTKRFDISFESCGYFDGRPRINICLFFFSFTLIFPFVNKNWQDECDPPKWGIAYHNEIFWIYRGGKGNMNGGNKWWTIYSPFKLDWVRTSKLRKDGEWGTETKSDRKDFYRKDRWGGVLWSESYPYRYVLKSGEVQERVAEVTVSEMEWRRHWFKWIPFFNKVERYIDVKFNKEIGEETDSWKGGCLGCGYSMLQSETPLECLRRMESNRKF